MQCRSIADTSALETEKEYAAKRFHSVRARPVIVGSSYWYQILSDRGRPHLYPLAKICEWVQLDF